MKKLFLFMVLMGLGATVFANIIYQNIDNGSHKIQAQPAITFQAQEYLTTRYDDILPNVICTVLTVKGKASIMPLEWTITTTTHAPQKIVRFYVFKTLPLEGIPDVVDLSAILGLGFFEYKSIVVQAKSLGYDYDNCSLAMVTCISHPSNN